MIDFADVKVIRQRVNLVDDGQPYSLTFDPLDIDAGRFHGLITEVCHVEGTIYDVVVVLSLYPEDYIAELREAQLGNRAEAFEASLEVDEDD